MPFLYVLELVFDSSALNKVFFVRSNLQVCESPIGHSLGDGTSWFRVYQAFDGST